MVITAAQRHRNLDLDNRCVRVTETVYEFGQLVKGTPKSRASIRTVVSPGIHLFIGWHSLSSLLFLGYLIAHVIRRRKRLRRSQIR